MLTLDRAPLRTPLTLVGADADAGLRARLAALGLRIGAQVRAEHPTAGGGRVVAVAGARIALDRSLLRALQVRAA